MSDDTTQELPVFREIRTLVAEHKRVHGIAPVEVRPTARRSELMIDGRGVLYVPRVVLHECTGTLEPSTFLGLPVIAADAPPEADDAD